MEENLGFVIKYMNLPNVPQTRPIENFRGCLAQKVYENVWEAKTEHSLVFAKSWKSLTSTFYIH
jgi:hypothetical protein